MPPNDSANPTVPKSSLKTLAGAEGAARKSHGSRWLMAVARQAAEAAGAVQMAHFAKHENSITASFDHDLKIDVDALCESAILGIIRRQFPDHALLSEEAGLNGSPEGEYIWIIDPLDGTVNYYHGIPYFCSCVACYSLMRPLADHADHTHFKWLEAACPVAAAVYAPAMGQMYCAAVGRGATCNGRTLRTPSVTRLGDAVVGVSLGSREHTIRSMTRLIERLAPRVRKVRMFGATGLDIVQVASGAASGLIQPRVQIWDFAAARVILEESGGAFHASADTEGAWQIVAATQPLLNSLKTMMETHQAPSEKPAQSSIAGKISEPNPNSL
jgi:fructose-1,6-bisphosphatase/inositol monophosphatase family enzyme